MQKILLIDNYDSFTYLISSIFEKLGAKVLISRKTEDLNEINALLISPGPGKPEDAEISIKMVERAWGKIPILGICLGMQIILSFEGGKIKKLSPPMHGKKTDIYHADHFLFMEMKNPFKGALYHSLGFIEVPKNFTAIAWDKRNVIMGIKHNYFPIFGIQFHPESFLSEDGDIIYRNFLNLL